MDLNEIKEILKIEYGNQKRRQGTPAYSHPFAVADILKAKGFNENYQTAGLLHDALEDTNMTYEEVAKISNEEIARIVKLLTKEKGYVMQNYWNGIMNDEKARTVKLADRFHNLTEAVQTDKDFRKKYIKETEDWYLKMAQGTCFEEDINNALQNLIKSL